MVQPYRLIANRLIAKTFLPALIVTAGFGPALSSAAVLEEIVVTAQKREQNLQDVSTAVTALGADRLSDANITNIEDIQYYVPTITMGNNGYANVFLRGLGLNTVFANVDPSVTMYVDGAVIARPQAQLFSFFDLERVEVLRGPQGTLYGRNATGGTINLITAKPSEELDGNIRIIAGDYGLVQTEGAIGGSLTDSLLGRFAFQSINRNEGFSTNQATGNDVNTANKQSFRGQLLFKPNDNVEFLLAAEYGTEQDSANGFYFKRETYPGTLNPAAAALGMGGFATGERAFASEVDPENDRKTWSVTGTLDWQINDQWALKNILNIREIDLVVFQDADASAVVTNIVQEFGFESTHISEELQLSFTGDRLRATGGVYYFTEDFDNRNLLDALKVGGSFAGGTEKRVNLVGNAETDSWAVYWNAIYDVTDQFSIKAGGRYTSDDRKIVNDNVIWVAGVLPGGGDLRLSPADGNLPLFRDEDSFSDYTNEFGVEWRPTDTMLLYYTYSEGFKAGTGQIGTNSANIIEPETIKNHEFGLKTTLYDRLVLNVAAYSYEVTDIQLDRNVPGGPTGFRTIFQNATTQDGTGVEIEALWAATEQFTLSASVAYQDTEFGSFLAADPTNEGNVGGLVLSDLAGNNARQAPEWAWNVRGAYDVPLNNSALLTLSVDVSFKDDIFFSEFNNELLSRGDYTLLDARVRYTSPDERWTTEIWGKNLTDELVESWNFAIATTRVTVRTYLPPRTWGVTVGYRI